MKSKILERYKKYFSSTIFKLITKSLPEPKLKVSFKKGTPKDVRVKIRKVVKEHEKEVIGMLQEKALRNLIYGIS